VSRLKLDKAPAPVLLEGDSRIRALQTVTQAPQSPEDYVDAIGRLWNRAQSAFLDIGRLLIRAKETLPHGDYISSVEDRLPFASRTAYQLREAARWALEMERRKTITLDKLPSSYSTIYLLSTLDVPTYEAAEHEGIVRPDLKRAELIAWRKGRAGGMRDRKSLAARRDHLLRERARIDDELRRVEAELNP
jgi:hypothetical protein